MIAFHVAQISMADDSVNEAQGSGRLDVSVHKSLVTFNVAFGEQFVSWLFADLTVAQWGDLP